jgi:hypothetical protein
VAGAAVAGGGAAGVVAAGAQAASSIKTIMEASKAYRILLFISYSPFLNSGSSDGLRLK